MFTAQAPSILICTKLMSPTKSCANNILNLKSHNFITCSHFFFIQAKRGKRKIEKENSDIEEKTDKVPQKKAKVSILKQCSMFLIIVTTEIEFLFSQAKSAKKRVAKENSDSENNEDEEVSIQKVKVSKVY